MTQKNRHLRTIAQLFQAISSQLRHVSTIGNKVKHQYLLHMSPQYGKLRPTNGWDQLVSLGHPSKFQRVSHLGFVTAPMALTRGQPNFVRLWPSPVLVHYIYIFQGLLPPDGILPHAKFTLCRNLAFAYIGSITAWHSSSGASQTLWRHRRNGTTELSQRAPPI